MVSAAACVVVVKSTNLLKCMFCIHICVSVVVVVLIVVMVGHLLLTA